VVGDQISRNPRASAKTGEFSAPVAKSSPEPSAWLRVALVLGICAVVGGGLAALILRPSSTSVVTEAAAGGTPKPAVDSDRATLHVVLERPAIVLLDGVAQPPGTQADVIVKARTPHELRVKPVDGADAKPGPSLSIPPLEPGEVKTIRPRLGN
jgi:hypothetical protein